MTLVLARRLDDPHALLAELQGHWRHGAVVGIALEQERPALVEALAATGGDPPFPAAGGSEGLLRDPAGTAAFPGPGARARRRPGDGDVVSLSWRERGPALVLGSGGSGGARRWCLQPLSHLEASAQACGVWLLEQGIDPGRCLHLAALPLHHIGGLMPLIRARQWRAELRWLPPSLLRSPHQLPAACPLPADRPVLLSLVPTQLHRLLQSPEALAWLRRCAVIWVGGAALDPDQARRARAAALPLAPCYGATETAAMVCALPPERFLAGQEGCGAPLADVALRLEPLGEPGGGVVAVRTPRLSPGWLEGGRLRPFNGADGWWRSGDAGLWIPAAAGEEGAAPGVRGMRRDARPGPVSSLAILGRLDGAILSGGETVFPEQLERRLRRRAGQLELPLEQVLLLGVADPPWGERLVALVRPRAGADAGGLVAALRQIAAGWPAPQRPRSWRLCSDLAPTAAGKWERARWRAWLERQAGEESPPQG